MSDKPVKDQVRIDLKRTEKVVAKVIKDATTYPAKK